MHNNNNNNNNNIIMQKGGERGGVRERERGREGKRDLDKVFCCGWQH